MVFQCINIRQDPWEVLKTAASGLGFQHLPRVLANVNEWKNMFDPYSKYKGQRDRLIWSISTSEPTNLRCYNVIKQNSYNKMILLQLCPSNITLLAGQGIDVKLESCLQE